ncbi:hypothetical protein [Streptomyces sp. NPDC052727]|uniref:hypothetical protein n=1 Tax=unclassified Streptomyces TaxID=2593676 RepID=UPI00342D6817
MVFRENDVDGATWLCGDFVGGVLDELEELPVTVSALGDASFSVRVLRNETGIDGVRLEDAGGLVDHGLEHGGQFERHRTPILEQRPDGKGTEDRTSQVTSDADATSVTLRYRGDDWDALEGAVVPEVWNAQRKWMLFSLGA